VAYAIKNNLEWAEDVTNDSPKYLRNRVRYLTAQMSAQQRRELISLYQNQTAVRAQIEKILEHKTTIYKDSPCKTGGLELVEIVTLPNEVAIEVLRKITQQKLTTPQLKNFLNSLKTAKSGDLLQPGGKIQAGIYRGYFTIT
jgi:tRNA(Ile)-lysidine synthase TilS/MesJ